VEFERTSVFILAENRLLREALTRLLGKKNNIRIAEACAFSSKIVSQVLAAAPDILLSDSSVLAMPDLQVLAELRSAMPGIKIVMIGMEEDRVTFLRAIREGVAGYVLKDADASQVACAVRTVADGNAVCPPSLAMALFEFVAAQRPQTFSLRLKHDLGLTRREQQLVLMIDRGLTNKEIAAQLNLSEQTIKNHVHRMLRKLGAADRLTAAEMCRAPLALA
jgi:DNA-binding NarL/FixJ family response regulator